MAVKVGSARIDENGKTHGGKAGDQNGKEVSTQAWYRHKKGWRVLRCKSADKADKIARAMQAACDNANIGYDQYQRDTLYNLAKTVDFDPGKVKTPCETDCSALVRVCCAYAGIRVGNFRTTTEARVLLASGEFTELKGAKYTDQSAYLHRGDILVTCTQGHTVVVLTDGAKAESPAPTPDEETEAHETLKRGMKGDDVRRLQQRLIELGYALPKYGADGEYGSETVTAVKAFQLDRGLEADGIAGEKTLAALYAGQGNTYTVTLHNVPEAEAIALISKYDGEIQGALG